MTINIFFTYTWPFCEFEAVIQVNDSILLSPERKSLPFASKTYDVTIPSININAKQCTIKAHNIFEENYAKQIWAESSYS